MSKRFTATEKWDDPWFRKLSPTYKLLWQFICDKCDNAGVWKKDFELAEFCIREKIDEQSAFEAFCNGKERIIKLNDDYWLISDFVRFQFGELSKNCKQHAHIITLIESHRAGKGYPVISLRADTGVGAGVDATPKDKDKDKDKEKDKEKDKVKDKGIVKGNPEYSAEFDGLWAMYPRQEGKKEAYRHYLASVLTDQDRVDIKKAIDNYCAHIKREKTELRYIKQGSTFFNNWRDYVNFSGQPIRQETRYGNFV